MGEVDAHVHNNLSSGIEIGISADRDLVDGVNVVELGVLHLVNYTGALVDIEIVVVSSHVEEHHSVALLQALLLAGDDISLVSSSHGLAIKRCSSRTGITHLLVVHVSGEKGISGEDMVLSSGRDLIGSNAGEAEKTESKRAVVDQG